MDEGIPLWQQLIDRCLAHPIPMSAFRELSPEEKSVLLAKFRTGNAIARRLSRPSQSVAAKRVREALARDGIDPDSLKLKPRASFADEPPLADVSYWQARCELLDKENQRLNEYYARHLELMRAIVPRLDPVVPDYPHTWDDSVDEELTFLMLADMHIGELVRRGDVAGMSEYNFEIFKERCGIYKRAVDNLINGHLRKTYPLRKCYVGILGDITTGEAVFPKQAQRIDLLLMDQIMNGAWYVCDILRFICSIFDEVWAYCVPGNHGGQRETTLNTDYLLYYFMKLALADQPNLHFRISDSRYLAFYLDASLDVIPFLGSDRRWNFLLAHGNEARGWAGIPYYGLDRMEKRLADSTKIVFDKMWAGHHHQRASTSGWDMVGSWMGGSEFSMKTTQAASRPSQLMQGFHPKMGLTWKFDIYLGEEPRLQAVEGDEGIYTPVDAFGGLLEDSA